MLDVAIASQQGQMFGSIGQDLDPSFKYEHSEIDHTSKKTGISVVGDDGKPFCFPDKAIRRDVDNLEVQCCNSKLGCQWVGQLRQYFEIHEMQCCFKAQPCPHCNEPVLKDKLEKHFATECPKRTVPCEHCATDRSTALKHYNEDCGVVESMPKNSVYPSNPHDQDLSQEWSQFRVDTERRLSHLECKYKDMERQVTMLGVRISEIELQVSLASTYNGSFMLQFPDLNQSSIQLRLSCLEQAMYSREFVFRILDLSNQRKNAVEGHKPFLDSPPFYTAKNGYKMCIRVYLNGDGMGHKTHLSLFFALMRGEFDALLKWPFDHRVSLTLVDQTRRNHIVQTFKPTPESSSFQRPISDMNVASGCPQFCKLSFLDDDNYIKDNVLFIKCIVDTSHFCSIPA